MTPDRAASIRARLLNLAKARGEEFNLVLTRYAIERFHREGGGDRGQRFQEVSGEDRALCLGKAERQLLEICDGGHGGDSSEFGRRGRWHSRPYPRSAPVQDRLRLAVKIRGLRGW
jgi:hypothetical protein